MTIVFGSAIVPKWKEGRISFKNVIVTRRDKSVDIEALHEQIRRGTPPVVGQLWDSTVPFGDNEEVAPPITSESSETRLSLIHI